MKFLRLLARVRYWKRRALKAETRLIAVSADAERRLLEVQNQAEAERWRNYSREDMFASAAAFGGRGMVGISPRTGPAAHPELPRLAQAPDPMQSLNFTEKMEYQTQWLAPGLAEGHSPQRIQQDFLKELAGRKNFNDEPMN